MGSRFSLKKSFTHRGSAAVAEHQKLEKVRTLFLAAQLFICSRKFRIWQLNLSKTPKSFTHPVLSLVTFVRWFFTATNILRDEKGPPFLTRIVKLCALHENPSVLHSTQWLDSHPSLLIMSKAFPRHTFITTVHFIILIGCINSALSVTSFMSLQQCQLRLSSYLVSFSSIPSTSPIHRRHSHSIVISVLCRHASIICCIVSLSFTQPSHVSRQQLQDHIDFVSALVVFRVKKADLKSLPKPKSSEQTDSSSNEKKENSPVLSGVEKVSMDAKVTYLMRELRKIRREKPKSKVSRVCVCVWFSLVRAAAVPIRQVKSFDWNHSGWVFCLTINSYFPCKIFRPCSSAKRWELFVFLSFLEWAGVL